MRDARDPAALKYPVTSAQGAASVVPAPSTPQGGSRRYVLHELIAINNAAGAYTDRTPRFRLSIPSCRLHTKVTVGYKPYSGEWLDFPQSGPGKWTLDIREFARTDQGFYVPGGRVVQGLVLPNSWEATTMSREWRCEVTIPATHDGSEGVDPGTGLSVPGQLFAVAEWEPAAGESEISDKELGELFGACHLGLDSMVVVSSSGT